MRLQKAKRERRRTAREKNREIAFPAVVALYALFGVVAVYSASSYNAEVLYGDSLYFFRKQLLGFVLGLVGLIFFCRFDYRKLYTIGWIRWAGYFLPVVLLLLVFVPGIGVTNYGATRWVGIGPITLQPSELAKYGFVLFASAYIAADPARVRSFWGILPLLATGGGVCLLVLLEPNMSVTVLLGGVMLGMVFLSGTKWYNLLVIAVPVLFAVPVLIAAEPYRLLRLSAFLNPWASPKDEGYQLIQSLYALGNGGWFGTGLFHSRQKYRFLPFAESDFILSVIGEELGFIGILLLFAVAGWMIYKGFSIGLRSDTLFGCMLANGITLVFALQTLLNALVVSGSIPPTGLPLPLVSSGNTSLIVTMCSMGVVVSVANHKESSLGHIIG